MAPDWQKIYFPYSPLEIISLTVCSVIQLAQVCCSIYLLRQRRFAPIRAKQVPFLALASLGGSLLFLGHVYSRAVIDNTLPFFDNCTLWYIWIFLAFGGCLFLAALAFRLFLLYAVLSYMHSRIQASTSLSRSKVYVLGFSIMYAPYILLAAIFSLPVVKSTEFVPYRINDYEVAYKCSPTTSVVYLYAAVILYAILWAVFFLKKTGGIRKSFNESSTKYGFLASVVGITVFLAITLGTPAKYWGSPIRECALYISLTMSINCYYWSLCFDLVVGRLLYPEETLRRFNEGLQMTHLSQMDVLKVEVVEDERSIQQ